MDVKYLAFEAIKSGCGAELTIQLVNQDDMLIAPQAGADMYLQVSHVLSPYSQNIHECYAVLYVMAPFLCPADEVGEC